MEQNYIRYEKRDRIAVITFNQPKKMNALSNGLIAELRQALDDIAGDSSSDRSDQAPAMHLWREPT